MATSEGHAGQLSFSLQGLEASGESGYSLAAQLTQDGNNGNVTVLIDKHNDLGNNDIQVTLTPSEFEALREFFTSCPF